jgi:hypothetical protein
MAARVEALDVVYQLLRVAPRFSRAGGSAAGRLAGGGSLTDDAVAFSAQRAAWRSRCVRVRPLQVVHVRPPGGTAGRPEGRAGGPGRRQQPGLCTPAVTGVFATCDAYLQISFCLRCCDVCRCCVAPAGWMSCGVSESSCWQSCASWTLPHPRVGGGLMGVPLWLVTLNAWCWQRATHSCTAAAAASAPKCPPAFANLNPPPCSLTLCL